MYGAYISEAFYEKTVPEQEQNYSVVFKVRNNENLNEDEMVEKIKDLAADLGVAENLVVTNDLYLMWTLDPGRRLLVPVWRLQLSWFCFQY